MDVRAVTAIRVKTELPQLDFSGVSTEQHSCHLEAFHLTKKHKQVRFITFFLLSCNIHPGVTLNFE